MTTQYTVSLHCETKDEATVPRITEIIGRAAAGMALDGIESTIHFDKDEWEEVEQHVDETED